MLAAVPVKILGGEILARFAPKDEKHARLISKAGLTTRKVYNANALARGRNLVFAATGIIDGPLLRGVRLEEGTAITHSMVVRGASGTIRHIETLHRRK